MVLQTALMTPPSLRKSPAMPRLPIVSSLCLALLTLAPAAAQENAAVCKDEASTPDAAVAACGKIIAASKAVFVVEYAPSSDAPTLCSEAARLGYSLAIKRRALDAFRCGCPAQP